MCGHVLLHPGWSEVFVALEAEASSAHILAPDLSLLFVNQAWRTFARQNGAPELAEEWRAYGPILRAVSPAQDMLRAVCETRLRRVLATQVPWTHVYECSSKNVYRRFLMRARAGPGAEGVVVVHSLVVEESLVPGSAQDVERRFTDERGLIVRCAACGRTARPDQR